MAHASGRYNSEQNRKKGCFGNALQNGELISNQIDAGPYRPLSLEVLMVTEL